MKAQWDCVLNDLEELGGTELSWRISAIHVYFLVSSSSCHAFLPLFVRPMMTIQEMFLKIVFDSPEFNRSIIVSSNTSMTKKLASSTLENRRANIFLVQHQLKFSRQYVQFLWMSWQNLVFFVVLLWPLIGLPSHLHSILTHILRTAFLRFPARCCSSSWPTCLSHEKFWPMSENCLCSQT